MRTAFLLFVSLSLAQEHPARYGVALDAKTYPQTSAKETLSSTLQAIDAKRIDYLVAHLADPTFIDDRVKRLYAGKFDEQVQDTRTRLDPGTVKQLKRFLADGKWTTEKDGAMVALDEVKDRIVRFVRKDGRWYLQHDQSTDK